MTVPTERTAVITGIGVLSSMGRGIEDTFDAMCSAKSNLSRPPADDPIAELIEVASIAPPVDPAAVLPPPVDSCVDRYVLLGLAAADDAIADAGLRVGENLDPLRAGIVVSTGGGGLKTYEDQAAARHERGRTAISPYLAPGMLPNMAAARIAIKYGLRGYSSSVSTACAAGAQSVAEGLRLIREGQADVVVCGGADAPLHATIAAAFANANAMARGFADPTTASRPFDRRRNGFVLGEGAAVVVLERTAHADARGAAGYADVLGWGATTDGYHLTAPRPDGQGAAECMRRVLRDAGVEPSDIGYINAHGTSTRLGDAAEAKAIRAVFGDDTPPVSSTKSMTGHLLGAAGSMEAAVTAMAVAHGVLPPTRNLDEVDRGCDLNHIRQVGRTEQVELALSNSFGFGGHNVSLVLGPASTRLRRTAGKVAGDA
jgi:3-oxoacyl-[acyl-carrier-protein] synthase II